MIPVTSDRPDLESQAVEAIKRLRHFAVLDPHDVATWLSVAMQRDPERVLWHIRRADGTSSSTVVDYVLHERGHRPDCFGRPARLADAERLLKTVVRAPTEPMRRGTLLEPVLEGFFLRTQGSRFTKDAAALEKVSLQLGTRECPSLRASPDTILATVHNGRPWTLVIDYKCPGLDPAQGKDAGLEDEEVRLRYTCQLHSQAMVANAAGVTVNGMAIVNLVCPPSIASAIADDLELAHVRGDGQAAIDRAVEQLIVLSEIGNGRLVRAAMQPVPFSIDLAREIVKAANAADARVQRGEMAAWPERPQLAISDEARDELKLMQLQVASAIAMEAAAEKRAVALKQALAAKVLPYARVLASVKADAPLLALTAPSVLDADAAVDHLMGLHVDPSTLTKPGPLSEEKVSQLAARHEVPMDSLREVAKPDNDAIRKALEAHGEGLLDQFTSHPSINIGLARGKRGAAVKTLDALKHRASQLVEQASSWGEQSSEAHIGTDPSSEWSEDLFPAGPEALSP